MRQQFGTHPGKPFIHRSRIRIKIDEKETAEILDRHRCQANLLAAESLDRLDVRAGPQPPLKIIAPGMIGTGDHWRPPAALDKLVRAVLADIVEGVDRAIPVQHTEQGLAGHLEGEIVPRVLKLRGMPGELPAAGEQTARFNVEDFRVGVVARVQRQQRVDIIGHGLIGSHGYSVPFPLAHCRQDAQAVRTGTSDKNSPLVRNEKNPVANNHLLSRCACDRL